MGRSLPRNRDALGHRQSLTSRIGKALHSLYTQHQSAAVDSLLRLLAEPLGSLMAWFVIGIALALPLCLLLLLLNLQALGGGVGESGTLSLYLDRQLDAAELEELQSGLAARGDIAALRFVSAGDALEEFRRHSGFGDVLDGLDENPLPPVLLVTPVATDAAGIQVLRDALQDWPGVELVVVDLEWLQRLGAIVDFAIRLAGLLGVLLGFAIVLVISNTVRMAIATRRAEIVVTKLVGATDAYVARPFLYTGLWYGAGGGLGALLIVSFCLHFLKSPLATLVDSYGTQFALVGLGISEGFGLVVVAASLGWLGAWVSVHRHLRTIEPA